MAASCGHLYGYGPGATARSDSEAAAAIEALDDKIERLNHQFGGAFWVSAVFPTEDAMAVSAAVENMILDAHAGGLVRIEQEFGAAARAGPARKLLHLGHRSPHPLTETAEERAALGARIANLARAFDAIEVCHGENCFALQEAEQRMHLSEDAAERLALWAALRREATGLAPQFVAMKEALNEAARAWGYAGMGEWAIARYEYPPQEFFAELDALHAELEPLAAALRCHVSAELGVGETLSADELYSFWGRDWDHLHERVRAGLPGYEPLDLVVDEKFASVEEMVRWAEGLYRSAGFPPLPESFWTGSQFTEPERDIKGCPRFGTNVDWRRDVRLVMCGKRDREHLVWSHGILAFLYYDLAFADQDWVYRDPPHLGFHFGNSDAFELALTPEFLRREGLLRILPTPEENLSRMLNEALRLIPRIGYGFAAERWRWEAFGSGRSEEELDARWAALRLAYQGVAPPQNAEGSEPLSQAVIVRNADLLQNALGEILDFQFYKEACRSAGHEGPLHECSFYGHEGVAERLWPVLTLGSSRPWPEILEAYTGSPRMSAAPMLEYFAPLRDWLETKNRGRRCA